MYKRNTIKGITMNTIDVRLATKEEISDCTKINDKFRAFMHLYSDFDNFSFYVRKKGEDKSIIQLVTKSHAVEYCTCGDVHHVTDKFYIHEDNKKKVVMSWSNKKQAYTSSSSSYFYDRHEGNVFKAIAIGGECVSEINPETHDITVFNFDVDVVTKEEKKKVVMSYYRKHEDVGLDLYRSSLAEGIVFGKHDYMFIKISEDRFAAYENHDKRNMALSVISSEDFDIEIVEKKKKTRVKLEMVAVGKYKIVSIDGRDLYGFRKIALEAQRWDRLKTNEFYLQDSGSITSEEYDITIKDPYEKVILTKIGIVTYKDCLDRIYTYVDSSQLFVAENDGGTCLSPNEVCVAFVENSKITIRKLTDSEHRMIWNYRDLLNISVFLYGKLMIDAHGYIYSPVFSLDILECLIGYRKRNIDGQTFEMFHSDRIKIVDTL